MSKYIDLELALNELLCVYEEYIERYGAEIRCDIKTPVIFDYRRAKEALQTLPTIEVSEEVLKATKNFNVYTIADENAEMGMRTQIEPIIEVSEDCISREYILGEAFASDEYNRETKSFDLPVVSVRDIEDAPSVVPICQKNRQVERAEGEWELASDNDGEYGNCSICGNDADFTHYGKAYHYCPNCGAKMKG